MQQILSQVGIIVPVLVILAFFLLTSAVKVVQEYERGVIFRLGRLMGAKGPGLFFIIPFIDRMMKIDLRVVTMDVPAQEVITRDNVTIKVNAVIYFKVVDPNMAVVKVLDYIRATSQIAQTTLRARAGPVRPGRATGPAGADQPPPPADHRRADGALGREGQRGRGEGRGAAPDDAASHGQAGRGRAREAGQDHPRPGRVRGLRAPGRCGRHAQPQTTALQLRYLQTLTEIAVEKNSTIIFPVPIDLISALITGTNGRGGPPPPAVGMPPRESGTGTSN